TERHTRGVDGRGDLGIAGGAAAESSGPGTWAGMPARDGRDRQLQCRTGSGERSPLSSRCTRGRDDSVRGSPEGGWYFAKVLWVASPSYTGRALIRGHQIDGPNEVRFENGSDPPLELRFDGNPLGDGWRHQPSYTRVRAPGCYAYQVDGIPVSSVIVFEATLEN
ncbi:MAG TPA: hypothetical protein VIP07_13005, partial [Candidatus Limnocylindria bacterium]